MFGLVILAVGVGIWAGSETEELEDFGSETEELEDFGSETEDMEALERDLSAIEQELEQDLSGLESEHLVGLAGVELGDVEALERDPLALEPEEVADAEPEGLSFWESIILSSWEREVLTEEPEDRQVKGYLDLKYLGAEYLLDSEPEDLKALPDSEREFLKAWFSPLSYEEADAFESAIIEYRESDSGVEYVLALVSLDCDELERKALAETTQFKRDFVAGDYEATAKHTVLSYIAQECAESGLEAWEQTLLDAEPEDLDWAFGLEYVAGLEPEELRALPDSEREYLKWWFRGEFEEEVDAIELAMIEYSESDSGVEYVLALASLDCDELEREMSAELPQFKRATVAGDHEAAAKYYLLIGVVANLCV